MPFAAVVIAGASVAARASGIASPIVMLLAGIALALVPGLGSFTLDPELVLITLLPPILYASGVGMSWRGFRANLRPILLLAVGCVAFTAGAVALTLHLVFAIPLAVAFVLGAIVSPPDAVAPAAVLKTVAVPRRIRTVLEGESLINDATALVAFTFAVGAVATGEFSAAGATGRFLAIVVSEIAYGVVVGAVMLGLRHVVRDPRAEVLLALATPYLAFLPAHAYGGSGVVACVVAGLWVSWNGRRLIRPATRLQGYFIWDLVTWTVEAIAFLLTGLQAVTLSRALAGTGWSYALGVAAVTVVTVIVVRFVWVFPATYLARLIPAVRRADPAPRWQVPTFIGFAGVRGVVSMIAALSIPLTVVGQPFPERDVILFATFATIVVTMVGLGPLMRPLATRLGLTEAGAAEQAHYGASEREARREGIEAVLRTLEAKCGEDCSDEEVAALRRRHLDRLHGLNAAASPETPSRPAGALQLRLLEVERRVIADAYLAGRVTDAARRRIEREFDLEEARIGHALASMGAGR